MNLPIQTLYISIVVLNFVAAAFTIFNLFELKSNASSLEKVENNRYLMVQKAEMLRQTSDDLTRFARTYAVTLDPQYKENYYAVVDIRSGKAPRPKNYEHIYWDLLPEYREDRHPLLGEPIALYAEMKQLPYTNWELSRLTLSEKKSNQLVNLEEHAFQLITSLGDNLQPESLSPDQLKIQQQAIQILHSPSYHLEKQKIMLPIDEFMASIEERSAKDISVYNQYIIHSTRTITGLFLLQIFILIISIFITRKKLIKPIFHLAKHINLYQAGDRELIPNVTYTDEIGLITKQFMRLQHRLNEQYDKVEKISLTDELTQTYNRKYYNTKLDEFFLNYQRYQQIFSIIMLDYDNFKQINDSFGHAAGDNVLVQISAKIKELLRKNDYFFRVGGEEFIILLPGVELDGACAVADKIRAKIANYVVFDQQTITISLGVTEIREYDTQHGIYERVDKLLYQSKLAGKNRYSKA